MMSELNTFRIAKAKAKVNSGSSIYVNINAKDHLSQLISIRKRKRLNNRGDLISLQFVWQRCPHVTCGPRICCALIGFFRSKKLQNESFSNLSNFRPKFLPEFCSNCPRIFRGVFVLRFMGDGDQKKFTKIPAVFQCKNPRQTQRKIPQKFSGEPAK